MNTFSGIEQLSTPLTPSVVTIGNFDGLHLGHQELIRRLKSYAKKYKASSVVLTFDPHPLEVLAPELGHMRIFTKQDLQEQLQEWGVDVLNIQAFSSDFAKTSAEEFLENYLWKPFQPHALVVGHDFAFGSDRTGTLVFLKAWCKKREIELEIVEPIEMDKVVSSSRIRQCIRLGEMKDVAAMLGRAYYVSGTVVRGEGRGRTIGVPTINLRLLSDIQPAPGVYVTAVHVDGKWLPSVSNIGCKPTFQKSKEHKVFTVETHILNFSSNLYGETLRIRFHQRLRDEKRFSGPEELVAQIKKDISAAKAWFEEVN